MADGYDRFDNNEGSGGGSFVMGLLTGTVLGAGLGMLFAPKAGSELRGQISEQAGNLANQASEGYRRATENAGQWAEKGKETAGEWAERGKDMYGKAKDAVDERRRRSAAVRDESADEAQKYVRDTANTVASADDAVERFELRVGHELRRPPSTGPSGSPGSTGGTRRS